MGFLILKFQTYCTAALLPRKGPFRAFAPLCSPAAPSLLPLTPSMFFCAPQLMRYVGAFNE